MKKIYTTILVVAMMFGMQSSVMAETYQAWGAVLFSYVTSPMYDAGESIEVTSETIKFHSDTWGDGSFAAANGEGTLTMAGHGGAKDYAANITGSVESSQFVISVPSVMGGTTITVTLGDMPAAVAVDGSYKAGTYANASYFQKYSPLADQTVTIKVNEGLQTVSVSHTSETWGTFTYATVTVTANEDGSYTLAGEGTCAMPSMQGGVKNYASDFKGTVKDGVLTAELAVPAVMGGVTVMFNPADFEEVMLTAGVKTISTANIDAPVYDLKGRRVGTNYKGIVIKNGKKYYQK